MPLIFPYASFSICVCSAFLVPMCAKLKFIEKDSSYLGFFSFSRQLQKPYQVFINLPLNDSSNCHNSFLSELISCCIFWLSPPSLTVFLIKFRKYDNSLTLKVLVSLRRESQTTAMITLALEMTPEFALFLSCWMQEYLGMNYFLGGGGGAEPFLHT